jgi:hypothetical protein
MGGRFGLGIGGRLHVGMVAAFASEWVAGFARNPQFDAVQTMREIRDALSAEIAGMSYEEERRFIDEQIKGAERSESDPKRGK